MLINAWVASVPCCSVAGVRRRLQASGIAARSQQRPGVHEGRALASEAGDMWVNMQGPRSHFFIWLPTGEESALDGAEQAAALRVVHIDVGAAWRSEEAAFGDHSCKTRIFLAVSTPFFSQFYPTLQTIFTPFFVVQFLLLFFVEFSVCSFVSRCSLSCP